MKWFNIFYSPFPRPKHTFKNVFWLLLIALSATLFIIIFKPFDIENKTGSAYFNLAVFGLGLVFFLSIYFIEFLIPELFSSLYKNWSFGKAVIWYAWLILFVGAVMFISKSYLSGFRDFTWTEYFYVLGRLLGIGITVSFFVIGLFNYVNRKKYTLLSSNENYLITAANTKSLRLNLNDVMYMVSDDNYVDIHIERNGIRKKLVFRSSLKNIEDQIVNPITPIYRCHRRHLINITGFQLKKNTSRITTIEHKKYKDEIPVSKQYVSQITGLLQIRP
ncbi:LytTR family transcriptional regulator DNA-binding domain-containing protein [Muriicola soli]|uniref:HTH LytTR-type domain-containing protein n=1 Tax=Muriicola soli TaxID=2507538 RepID=A0A411E970_9FLAO|nr:LytTR family transcriptional regulator DNA-binding domain-containing protein [Muriicola soli]QBA64010.1 hypothetical protein EQY75_05335 [Muriicola soli]